MTSLACVCHGPRETPVLASCHLAIVEPDTTCAACGRGIWAQPLPSPSVRLLCDPCFDREYIGEDTVCTLP